MLDEINSEITETELLEKYRNGQRSFSRVRVSAAALNGTKLDGCDFSNSVFLGSDLRGASLIEANLSGAKLSFCNFEGAVCPHASFSHADLTEIDFSKANLFGATFNGATVKRAIFANCDLRNAGFEGVECRRISFSGSKLTEANFGNANLQQADFARASMRATVLHGGDLTGANLVGSDLTVADLESAILLSVAAADAVLAGANLGLADCRLADFSRCIVREARFNRARLGFVVMRDVVGERVDFSNADLTNGEFKGAKLKDSNFTAATLNGADFENADVSASIFVRCSGRFVRARSANLSESNFFHANFTCADLTGSSLRGANLTSADFSESSLQSTNLEAMKAEDANFSGAIFKGSFMLGSVFDGAQLSDVDARGAYLQGSRFEGSTAVNAVLPSEALLQNYFGHNTDIDSIKFSSDLETVSPKDFGHTANQGLSFTDLHMAAELYAIVRIFYATNRLATATSATRMEYGAGRSSSLSMGTCDVSIPRDHRMGKLEAPSVWRFEFREDPTKHVTVLSVRQAEATDVYRQLGDKAASSTEGDVLVFVHGYNVSFDDAARRTAQLSYDLAFEGAAVFFSWSSHGSVAAYIADGGAASAAPPQLKTVLSNLLALPEVKRIHIVAHSMGARVLLEALGELAPTLTGEVASKLVQVVFAAPDEDTERFEAFIRRFLAIRHDRITLYGSSTDEAIVASKVIHDAPRAGEGGPNLTLMVGVDTIDASSVDTSFLGHSYFGSEKSVISDLFYVIRHTFAPDQRAGLVKVSGRTIPYWRFRE